jgi:3-phenylpropionate/cinnamic acid dioxygenase small subunit
MKSKLSDRLCLSFALAAAALAGGWSTTPAVADELALEARLKRLEDEAEIRRLLDEYMDVLGSRDWDNYVLFFARDGELVMAEGTRKGRDDIRERMASASARMAEAARDRPQRQSADLLSNVKVEVDGDTATARSRFTFLSEDENGSFRVTGSGLYSDTWTREDGSWKIKRRSVEWDLLRGAGAPAPPSAPAAQSN